MYDATKVNSVQAEHLVDEVGCDHHKLPPAALSSTKPAPETTLPVQPPTPRGEPGTLNVIFSGTFMFSFCKEGCVTVLIPKVDGHVFRIGNWLGEVEMKPLAGHHGAPAGVSHEHTRPHRHDAPAGDSHEHGKALAGVADFTLELTAPSPFQPAELPPEHNLIFTKAKLAEPSVLASKLYARIFLPPAEKITSPRRTAIQRDTFVGGTAPDGYLGRLSSLQIFTYQFRDDAEVKLVGPQGGLFWEPAFTGIGPDRTLNLHIIAAPEHETGLRHVGSAFQALTGLLQNVVLSLPDALPPSQLHVEELPPGVSEKETEDLALRRRRLEQAARILKGGRDLNLLFFDSEALGPDPEDCYGSGCQECG